MTIKITNISSGFMPFVWALSETAHIESELEYPATPSPTARSKTPPVDGLMTLQDAASLPELGGVISIKTIRGAIARGDIEAVQPAGPGGAIYVTRNAIVAWIDRCPANQNRLVSTFVPREFGMAKSEPTRPGSSSMEDRKRARDAALKIAEALKKR